MEKVYAKTLQSIQSGDFYAAHQSIHSLSQRYLKAKRLNDAIDLLAFGAKTMYSHGQSGSGLDLVTRLLPLIDDIGILLDIALDVPLADLEPFIKLTLKSKGQPVLNHAFGLLFLRQGLVVDALDHFIHGTNESALLIGQCGADAVIKGVIGYLYLGQISLATLTLETHLGKKLDGKLHPSSSFMLNTLQALIPICERGSRDMFETLMSSLEADASQTLSGLVNVYFGKPQVNPMAEMFKSLMNPPQNMNMNQKTIQLDMDMD